MELCKIIDEATQEAAIVDPVDSEAVTAAVQQNDVKLTKVLTTHHHWDHAGGNAKLLKNFADLAIYGGDDRIEAINRKITHNDAFNIGNLSVKCLATPCHTRGHVCYYITGEGEHPSSVFTGKARCTIKRKYPPTKYNKQRFNPLERRHAFRWRLWKIFRGYRRSNV